MKRLSCLTTLLLFTSHIYAASPEQYMCGNDNAQIFEGYKVDRSISYGLIAIDSQTRIACAFDFQTVTPGGTDATKIMVVIPGDEYSNRFCGYMEKKLAESSKTNRFKIQVCQVGTEYRFLRYYDRQSPNPVNN